MFAIDPKKMSKPQYVCAVLWMEGRLSQNDIANRIEWKPGQVRGFLWRAFDVPRQNMSIEQRKEILAILEPLRADIGALQAKTYDDRFTPKKIRTLPLKAKQAEPVFLDTAKGRRERRKYEADKRRREAKLREKREREFERGRGFEGSPLEWLSVGKHLSDPHDQNQPNDSHASLAKTGSGLRRLEAGLRLRKYIEGSRLSALGSMNYENASMGGGGGPKLALPAYKLHCIRVIASMKTMMTKADFSIIEAVVEKDQFIWKHTNAKSQERRRIFEAIRYILDVVACHENLLTPAEFTERWKEELHQPDKVMPMDSVELHEKAEEIFRNGR